jgi:hypothetical protein
MAIFNFWSFTTFYAIVVAHPLRMSGGSDKMYRVSASYFGWLTAVFTACAWKNRTQVSPDTYL